MEERSAAKSHKIILGNRRTGNFTGVRDVISFDPKEILLETEMGMLRIRKENKIIATSKKRIIPTFLRRFVIVKRFRTAHFSAVLNSFYHYIKSQKQIQVYDTNFTIFEIR